MTEEEAHRAHIDSIALATLVALSGLTPNLVEGYRRDALMVADCEREKVYIGKVCDLAIKSK